MNFANKLFKTTLIFALVFLSFRYCLSSKTELPEDSSSFSNWKDVKQTFIQLNLDIDFNKTTLSGYVTLDFEVLKTTNIIVLDTWDLDISRIYDEVENKDLSFNIKNIYKSLIGYPLTINLIRYYKTSDKLKLTIYYKTSSNAQSTQWLTPDMTETKICPFFYTQNEPIYTRTLVPCQDTPSVKIPMDANISSTIPETCRDKLIDNYNKKNNTNLTFKDISILDKLNFNILFGGKRISQSYLNIGDTSKVVVTYKQTKPIPTYLLAIASGHLTVKDIDNPEYPGDSNKTIVHVWGEPPAADRGYNAFKESIYSFIKSAESYLSKYDWGFYDLLVLPPAFPYGGMENPNLTFVTPSIVQDKTQVNVAAHELAHSWTGNLLSNCNWNNFWLNEGFTVFFERKIIQLAYPDNGEEIRKLQSLNGLSDLNEDIDQLIRNNLEKYTALLPNIGKDNPDNAFSTVPYEKGYNILYYLENLVGEVLFKSIFTQYITTFQNQSVQVSDFINLFQSNVINNFDKKKADEIMSKIDWDTWLNEKGPIKSFVNDFSKIK